MSLSGWLRLPAARLRARIGNVPERPWIVPSAVGWLNRRIRGDWEILELGSGRSTPWLARRAKHVISFEHDPDWHRRARERLDAAGLDNCDLRLLPVESFASEVEKLTNASFDLVIVDFLEPEPAERVDAVRAVREKVRPQGLLLLDDTDRPAYSPAYEVLSGWRERRFVGVKDEWAGVCETSIFRRPADWAPES